MQRNELCVCREAMQHLGLFLRPHRDACLTRRYVCCHILSRTLPRIITNVVTYGSVVAWCFDVSAERHVIDVRTCMVRGALPQSDDS